MLIHGTLMALEDLWLPLAPRLAARTSGDRPRPARPRPQHPAAPRGCLALAAGGGNPRGPGPARPPPAGSGRPFLRGDGGALPRPVRSGRGGWRGRDGAALLSRAAPRTDPVRAARPARAGRRARAGAGRKPRPGDAAAPVAGDLPAPDGPAGFRRPLSLGPRLRPGTDDRGGRGRDEHLDRPRPGSGGLSDLPGARALLRRHRRSGGQQCPARRPGRHPDAKRTLHVAPGTGHMLHHFHQDRVVAEVEALTQAAATT